MCVSQNRCVRSFFTRAMPQFYHKTHLYWGSLTRPSHLYGSRYQRTFIRDSHTCRFYNVVHQFTSLELRIRRFSVGILCKSMSWNSSSEFLVQILKVGVYVCVCVCVFFFLIASYYPFNLSMKWLGTLGSITIYDCKYFKLTAYFQSTCFKKNPNNTPLQLPTEFNPPNYSSMCMMWICSLV